MMADAACRELVDQPVDLGLGADVDAARRLVQDEQHRLPRQPTREHHLLLVAARQLRDQLIEVGRLDATSSSSGATIVKRLAPVKQTAGDDLVGHAQRCVVEDRCETRSSASCLRSSGAKPMPAAIAACGLSGRNGLPLKATVPPRRRS